MGALLRRDRVAHVLYRLLGAHLTDTQASEYLAAKASGYPVSMNATEYKGNLSAVAVDCYIIQHM